MYYLTKSNLCLFLLTTTDDQLHHQES